MKVYWAKAALDDMVEIQAYLEEHNPSVAWKTVEEITAAADALIRFSHRGRIGRAENTREYVMTSLPYVLVYELTERQVGIARVLHTSRLWPPE